ncbi:MULTISPECIES: hypothetical protein [unclassified Myroides]|uniref:hypothetical protein n=1 Tax=unclassified Myroides TaxID=2642485 RepID=UPI003D2F57E5
MKESLKKYLEYWDSDDNFFVLMRMKGFVWLDDEYLYMLNLIRTVLNDYKEDYLIPKQLVYFFCMQIPLLVRTMENPLFYINPPAPYTDEEYKIFIGSRIKELVAMEENFIRENYDKI